MDIVEANRISRRCGVNQKLAVRTELHPRMTAKRPCAHSPVRQEGQIDYIQIRGQIRHALAVGTDPNSPQASDAKKFLVFTTLDGNPNDLVAAEAEVQTELKSNRQYVPALMAQAALGLGGLWVDEHRTAVIACLQTILAEQPVAHWVERLTAHGVPCAPVNGVAEALADPQVAARGLVADVPVAPVPVAPGVVRGYRCVRGPLPTAAPPPTAGAPTLGQHTVDVLAALGYSPERLAALVAAGVIAGDVTEWAAPDSAEAGAPAAGGEAVAAGPEQLDARLARQ